MAACSQLLVQNGDDCIPTNVGPDNTDSRDILVERVSCHCGTNGGVLIIAAQNSIHNVTFRDMLVNGTNQVVYAAFSALFRQLYW